MAQNYIDDRMGRSPAVFQNVIIARCGTVADAVIRFCVDKSSETKNASCFIKGRFWKLVAILGAVVVLYFCSPSFRMMGKPIPKIQTDIFSLSQKLDNSSPVLLTHISLTHGSRQVYPARQNSRQKQYRYHRDNNTKLILLWTTFCGYTYWLKTANFTKCNSKCNVTEDKSEIKQVDSVIFHWKDLPRGPKAAGTLPDCRLPHQRWVIFNVEPPHKTRVFSAVPAVFNWTAWYRFDSDIHIRYGGLQRRHPQLKGRQLGDRVAKILSGKSKLVAVRISNCRNTKSNRLKFIADLKQFINVDFYGRCGNISFPPGEEGDKLFRQYKFYLSLENSNCTDYITEKFWNPLRTWQSVPVAMGGADVSDYTKVAPRDSFIHVSDFDSPRSLAKYLRWLDKHDDAYKAYFKWQRDWEFVPRDWCPLCDALHNSSLPPKTYHDFRLWSYDPVC